MKRTVLATAIILASVLAFGSGQDDVAADGPVTLQLMEVQEQMWDGFVAVIADWEAATGNKIEVTLIPGNQIEQVLISRINADEAPDIFMSQGASYENLLPPGSVAPLNDRPFAARIPESTKELMYYSDGTLPYVPLVPLNGQGIAYNKTIFNELGISEPTNRLEFLAACESIKNAGIVPLNYQGGPNDSWGLRFLADPMYAYYDKYYAEDGHWEKLNTNQAKFAEIRFYEKALTQLLEYIELGYVNEDYMERTFDQTKAGFANGDVAMCLVAEWIVGAVAAINPDFEMGFFPLPMEDDREGVIASFIGTGISVWNDSPHRDAALDFFDFLCTVESQEKFYTLTPGTPIFPDVEVAMTPVGESIMAHAARNNAMPRMLLRDKVFSDTPYKKALEEMFSLQITPAEFLETWDETRINIGQQRGLEGF
jgi:raffinose/stachyose/melibiose transport system substrate-binding protein